MSERPDRSIGGLYALIDLGGAPLDPADCAVLGLDAPGPPGIAAAAARDAITPAAAHRLADGGRLTLFLGALAEPEEMADRLGLPRTTAEPVLARAALDRFGPATPDELLGDWMMLDHPAAGSTATLLVGLGGRMPMLWARVGDRLAVASSIDVLSRLGWVGRALDDESFLLALTICLPDDARLTRTVLRGVRRVPRGGYVTIARGREPALRVADPFVAVPPWTGSRGEAIEAAEALLHRIVRQRLARAPAPGLLLSGGLDSSLIAWTLAAAGATALPALSSAVASGRGVADETGYAALVADALGLALHRVVPPPDAPLFRPSAATLATSNGPMLSPRDYVYTAFADTAAALGVTELFDGTHGELTFTASVPVRSWRSWPRSAARSLRDLVRGGSRQVAPDAESMLDVALAAHRRTPATTALIEAIAAAMAGPMPVDAGRWGYPAGARPPLRRDPMEARPGRLRFIRPYHDIRLLRLFASFPPSVMVGEGLTRWPARAILQGRLPDTIVRRRRGMPFSPDYELRLAEQAPAALARLPAFRASGCDEWFDLAWLDDGLRRVAAGREHDADDALRVQLTAHACEFLAWWRSG